MAKTKSSYGAFEAKTHFSDLLDRVEQGDRITITRHGRVVAALVPSIPKANNNLVEIGRRAWESTRGTSLPEGMTIKDLINAGRKR
jgi:prevent-host-death family protein